LFGFLFVPADGGVMFLRNVGLYQKYTMINPRRHRCEIFKYSLMLSFYRNAVLIHYQGAGIFGCGGFNVKYPEPI
jgi:hypothetical protein